MKKFIQIFSFLVLAFAVSVVSAKAQATAYKANIPFDFKFGAKSYPAGNYSFKVARRSTDTALITLADRKGGNLKSVFAVLSGSAAMGKAALTFSSVDGTRYARSISTPDGGLRFNGSTPKKRPGMRITSMANTNETVTLTTD